MKKILYKKDAREKLAQGAQIMEDAVGTTLSPKGRNVAITRQWGSPIIVHDGVTVAREVESKDEFINAGIQLIKEAAAKTNEEAGDGTTTSTILANQLTQGGMKILDDSVNAMVLRKQIDEAVPKLKERLKKISKKLKPEDIERVAFISSGDEEIGRAVASAVEKVGTQGLITTEEGGVEMELDYTEGMEFDKGYAAPHFITSQTRAEAVIDNPIVAVLGKPITLAKEILPLLEVMANIKKEMVIVGDVTGDALKSAIINKLKGNVHIVVIPTPGYADRKDNYLKDIALITGGQVISDELGLNLESFANQFDKKYLGLAKTVVAGRSSTVIVKIEETDVTEQVQKDEIKARNKQIKERIENLEENLKNEKSLFEKEKIQERIAKLTTGVAIVRVGAKTEASMRERLERTKDAISAAKAASEEGIVPGGGVAFLQMSQIFTGKLNDGERLLLEVLQIITQKLLENAGESREKQQEIIKEIKEKGGDFGYNVNTGQVEDLIKSGVIDPAKVIRMSLENAIAVAGSILSTDCLIVDEFEKVDTQMQMA